MLQSEQVSRWTERLRSQRNRDAEPCAREQSVTNKLESVGLNVHAKTIAAAVAEPQRDSVQLGGGMSETY